MTAYYNEIDPKAAAWPRGMDGGMVVADSDRCETRREAAQAARHRRSADSAGWANPDWIACRDNKIRPIEPGTFPLANGIPARVVRLRGYGNAIVPQVAAAFIEESINTLEHI